MARRDATQPASGGRRSVRALVVLALLGLASCFLGQWLIGVSTRAAARPDDGWFGALTKQPQWLAVWVLAALLVAVGGMLFLFSAIGALVTGLRERRD